MTEWDEHLRKLALDTLFELSNEPIYVYAPDGRFIDGNPALAERTGYPWEKLREIDFQPTVHPDDAEFVAQQFAAALAGETVRYQARGLRPDGTVYHAEVLNAPVKVDGVVVAVLGVANDLDELTGVRTSLDRIESRMFTALESLGEAMALVDADWNVTFLNGPAKHLLSPGGDDLVGTSLWDLDLPDPEGEAMLREVMATRRSHVRRRFDENLQRWVELTGFPAGDLLGIRVRDITEIEDARRRILDDSRRIHAQTTLLDSASDAIIMRGLDGVIEYANRASFELLGIDEPLEGRRLRDVLELSDEAGAQLERDLGRLGRWVGEVVVRRPDGSQRITEAQWQVVNDPEGNPDAVFCRLTDVTERRRQEELLARTQRMESIGTLASGIAHDLNNVLTPLMLSAQLLAADEMDPKRLRILAGMQQTVQRGSDMIRQVLTFARGVEGERTIVEIADLVRGFAEFCRDILSKNIRVEVSAADGLAVLGDPTQLLQVLMNLATNARDAMADGGTIRLKATGDEERVIIEVTDDGAGMPADVLARIFEPFYTTKGIGRGTGLGLSVSQAIARTHGGSLEATSEPGRGTTFRLELPRSIRAADPSERTADTGPIDLAGLRVLIVDDESDIVESASLVIERAGGAPMAVTDARDAQRLLRGAVMDVVLTDLVMPGTSGRVFLDWLAEFSPGMPVVAMTGVPEQGVHAAKRDNVRVTLDKPFTAERLLEALRTATQGDA